ncbi:hypothetical protein ACFQBQ_07925 [Granulicella cerasi]|uniref:Uncharacterized protein n=1 Tax=Granulicella cerasi TaxID=741063 RepID=A0ABW1Z8K5_9BACT|nr:hypothetical protein [Granulicella cerasi]
MGLDIRLPLGLIFLIIGAMMLAYGLATYDSAIYAVSMGINLNIIWGGTMTVFGIASVLLARRKPDKSWENEV